MGSSSVPQQCPRSYQAPAGIALQSALASDLRSPFNMGPTFITMAGMLTVAAAMSKAGVLFRQRPDQIFITHVLSHPVKSTTPSMGYPYSTSTSDR